MASIPPSMPPVAAKVLVVDDEPGLRHVLEVTFRRQGYEVVVAPGARQAVEQIRQHPQPFPLVLTDLVMPDGSGIEVLAAAKERSEATEVVVMTATPPWRPRSTPCAAAPTTSSPSPSRPPRSRRSRRRPSRR